MLAKILNDDPAPPSQVAASVPSEVERAILRCLRKDPARRYQSMADLKVALDDLIEDSAASRLAQTPAAPRRAALALGMGRGDPRGRSPPAYVAWRAVPAPDSATPLRAVPLTLFQASCATRRFRPTATTWSSPGPDRSKTTRTSTCSRLAPGLRYG